MCRDDSHLFVQICCPQRCAERVAKIPAPAELIADCHHHFSDDGDDLALPPGLADEEVGTEETGPKAEESFRVIERYFPSEAVSERGQRERYQRGKTPHTIFTWWARRPFAAACAVATTSLMESNGLEQSALDLIDEYCGSDDPGLLRVALEPLTGARRQRVLDLFGGGATIPIESSRLGAQTYAVDNNELAHFIQTCLLEISQDEPGLADEVQKRGLQLLEALRHETNEFYPARYAGDSGRTIAYLWSREVQCPGCEAWLSLMKRPWVTKRDESSIFIKREPLGDGRGYSIELCDDEEPAHCHSAWEGQEVDCPFCDHRIERDEMDQVMYERTRDRLLAACTSRGRSARGRKEYLVADEAAHFPGRGRLEAAIARDLNAMDETLPEASLPRWSGVTNPTLYGMSRHVDLFNLRQRAVLVRFCRLLREHHEQWIEELGQQRADGVAAFLSALIDQLVDWNSRLSTWISQNEQVGRGLSGPGMAMVWDHVEIDPLEEAPANLWDKLDRIVQGMKAIPVTSNRPKAVRADARELPFADDFFDVVATDPPYFDNIFYSALADCIYVWKRLALAPIFPDHFRAETTDQSRELTMNRHVHDDVEEATEYYRQGMEEVFGEVRRVLKPGGVLSLIFAHGTVDGWASIVDALMAAQLELVTAWPMYVERRHRPRGMSSRAVNTSFVLVARQRRESRDTIDWSRFEELLRRRLCAEDQALDLEGKYGPHTRGRTLFGLGISLYSQQGIIVDEQGEELDPVQVVERIARAVEELVGDEAWGVRRR